MSPRPNAGSDSRRALIATTLTAAAARSAEETALKSIHGRSFQGESLE